MRGAGLWGIITVIATSVIRPGSDLEEPFVQSAAYRRLIARLDECIEETTDALLFETAELLRMAKLDLVTRVNGITEDELAAFLAVLREGTAARDPRPKRSA